MMGRVLRASAVALGAGLAGALAASVVAGWRAAAPEDYWAAGYHRLVAAAVWERFDRWGPAVAALALVPVVVVALLRWRGRHIPAVGRTAGRTGLALLALVLGLRALGALDVLQAGRGRPNVLLISIDTLRADRLGAYGYERPTTATIDRRLAAAGVLFTDVYSQSPKTTPSHMTMLTSLYPSVHRVFMWDGVGEGQALNPAVHTLAEVLKNAGYATAAFTAGANIHRSRGFGQGFDVYRHGHELERTRDWLAGPHLRPFFLFFHTYAVHDPYLPPAAWVERLAPDARSPLRDEVPRLRAGIEGGWESAHRRFWAAVDKGNPADVRFVSQLYDAAVGAMDEAIVKSLLDDLDARGLADSTLVVLTSDHGEAFGEHGNFLHDDLYRETLRVPLVLRLPGRLPAGRRVEGRARLLDLLPTLLEVVGVPAPPGIQGQSLAALAMGGDGPRPAVAVSEHPEATGTPYLESLRTDGFTYIVTGPTEQLFDVAHDPDEQVNIAPRDPQTTAALRTDLDRWRHECAPLAIALGARGHATPDAETVRQLRALGYVE
jgi:arylsulfatase A-like enzyme